MQIGLNSGNANSEFRQFCRKCQTHYKRTLRVRNLRGGATPQRVTKRRGTKELGKMNMRNITVCQLGPETTQRQHETFLVALVHAFVCQTAPVICASKTHTTSHIQESVIGFNTAEGQTAGYVAASSKSTNAYTNARKMAPWKLAPVAEVSAARLYQYRRLHPGHSVSRAPKQ